MKTIRSPLAMLRQSQTWQRANVPIVFVPTMGALHKGHTALIDRARKLAGKQGKVVASIFVNPLQFGPKEDLSRYPRPLKRDLSLCEQHGVDVVFLPKVEVMTPKDASVFIIEELLSKTLCGPSRPGHFQGVCTIVAKLFHIVNPTIAVFGEKDYQQLAIIRRMVRDLNFSIRIVGHPTVREPDGLAMSSRNVYLSREERAEAPLIRKALLEVQRLAKETQSVSKIVATAKKMLSSVPLAQVDYLEVMDAQSLQPIQKLTRPAVCAAAVFFGKTRLIDNILLK